MCPVSAPISPVSDDMLEKLFPVIKRCLGRDENYDLRMDAAMVRTSAAGLHAFRHGLGVM